MADQPLTDCLRATLECFDTSGTPLTTTEVADSFDIGRRSAYDRLDRLVKQGQLQTKKVGASARVWWRPNTRSQQDRQHTTDCSGECLDWLPANESLIGDVLDEADVGVFVLDAEFRVVWINEGIERYFGLDRGDVLGSEKRTVIEEYITPALADPASFTDTVLATYDTNTYTEQFECHIISDASGEERWLEHRSKPIELGPCAGGRIEVYYDITERKQSALAHKQSNEQLAALNDLHTVVSEIIHAIILQSTREEIEQTVCEHLADSESYLFAWIGDADFVSGTVQPRAQAGSQGEMNDIISSLDLTATEDGGPTSRAFKTGDIHTLRDVDEWGRCCHGKCEQYGCHSSKAIPIVHEGTLYGVLTIYAERPDAFEGKEQQVINQLGEIVGHAIAATERKQALMSNEVVEFQFQIPACVNAVDSVAQTDGTITFDNAVTTADGGFLVYGTMTTDAVDTMNALVEAIPHWTAVQFCESDENATFELQLSDSPILSAVASLGGSIEQARIEDGDYRMTVHAPPGADIRKFTAAVEDTYPTVQLCKRQQIKRDTSPSEHGQHMLLSDLTDRQQMSLTAAYHAGFFEWPRDATGKKIAESLGITPPTFHYHLRAAHRKVFDQLLSSEQ